MLLVLLTFFFPMLIYELVVFIEALLNDLAFRIEHLAKPRSFIVLEATFVDLSAIAILVNCILISTCAMPVSIGEFARVSTSICISFDAKTMFLIVLPFTSIFLPIFPLKEALTVKVTINVLSKVGVAVWKNFQPFSILVAVQVLALVRVTVNPAILTCSTHFTILHFAFVDIAIFHVRCAGTLAQTPLIKAATPHIPLALNRTCSLRLLISYLVDFELLRGDLGSGNVFQACWP